MRALNKRYKRKSTFSLSRFDPEIIKTRSRNEIRGFSAVSLFRSTLDTSLSNTYTSSLRDTQAYDFKIYKKYFVLHVYTFVYPF